MKRNKYSAGAVKFSLWFMEFRKEVQLLAQGRTFDEIKALSIEQNIFGASSPIWLTGLRQADMRSLSLRSGMVRMNFRRISG